MPEEVLDEDHYGLEKVKERVLEFLAVRALTNKGDSPILCLAGPPGNRQDFHCPLGSQSTEQEICAHLSGRRAG